VWNFILIVCYDFFYFNINFIILNPSYLGNQAITSIAIKCSILTLWRKYFSELLGGEENRQEKEKRQHRVGEIEEITREELEQQLRKLKRKKAPGRDGIQNESWIYGTEREVDRLLEIMNGVWKGEGFPQEWKEGIICPIYKKGEKDTASNYRGITLLNTAYKVYAMIVEERLMKEMNERGALPDG
jgi:hypothetical protein